MLATSTHDNKRSEDVRLRIAALSRDPRALGRRRRAAGRTWRRRTASPAGPDREPRVPALPDARRHLADRARPARGIPAEGRARGQGSTRPGARRTPTTRRPWSRSRTGSSATRRSGPISRPSSRRSCAPRGVSSLVADAHQAHRPGRARHLPGHRALGSEPGRSRQPAPGRLRRAARAARLGRDGVTGRGPRAHGRRRSEAVRDPPRAGRPRGAAATSSAGPASTARSRPAARARRTSSRSAAAARSPSCRASCSASAIRRTGATRACRSPPAGGATSSRARRPVAATSRSRRSSGSFPVALLVEAAPGMTQLRGLGAAAGHGRAARSRAGGWPMTRDERGWWHADAEAAAGHRLCASCSTAASRAARPALALAAGRRPRALAARRPRGRSPGPTPGSARRRSQSAVIYELHVGTFTPEGTFDGAIERLGHLVDLGVTHVELMPVTEFPGERGWGYDGVDLFAPHHAYGGPDGFKRFVDACHARGLAVLLDVVYNHLGPAGNYLGQFGPYFTDDATRRRGAPAVNFDAADSDEVRRFFCDNAADVAARLPRRRAAARRGPRDRRHLGAPHPRAARRRGRRRSRRRPAGRSS